MLRIEHVDTFLIDIPTIRPHVLAMTTLHTQAIVLLRIRCSDGIDGVGEATTIGGLSYGEESPESIKLTIDTYLKPILLASDPSQIANIMRTIGRYVVGNRFAKCAVETALLDAMGKRHGLPMSELLGGRQRDTLSVGWVLASGETARDIAEAERMITSRRHNIFKLKIGKRALADDINHVVTIKKALGEQASIRVDVNQAWDESTASRGLAMLEDNGVDAAEQPISRRNRPGMARLAAAHRIAVMADESLNGPEDAFALAASGAADIFSVKIEQSGGCRAAVQLAAIADAAGVGLYGGTMLEGSIGTAASAHAFATFPHLAWGTELFGPLLLTEDILTTPLTYRDFALQIPTGAGLGIDVDFKRVELFRRNGGAPRIHAVSAQEKRP